MSDEERMELVKNTLTYAMYDLRLALCDLAVSIADSFGKNNRVSSVLRANKAYIQREKSAYVAELMND